MTAALRRSMILVALSFLAGTAGATTLVCQIDMESRPESDGPLIALSWFQSPIIEIGYAHVYNRSCDEATDQFCLSDGFGFSIGLQPSRVARLVPRISYWSNRGLYTGVSLAYYTGVDSGSALTLEPELGIGFGWFMFFGRLSILSSKISGQTIFLAGGARAVM